MCGILALIYQPLKISSSNNERVETINILESIAEKLKDAAQKLLSARGPDSLNKYELFAPRGNTDFVKIDLIASVLHIRGLNICAQPLCDKEGNILLWNGEIFGGLKVNEKYFLSLSKL
jgi:asparagine synthetase B (glutamine-hydrolysing)